MLAVDADPATRIEGLIDILGCEDSSNQCEGSDREVPIQRHVHVVRYCRRVSLLNRVGFPSIVTGVVASRRFQIGCRRCKMGPQTLVKERYETISGNSRCIYTSTALMSRSERKCGQMIRQRQQHGQIGDRTVSAAAFAVWACVGWLVW